MEPLCKDIYSDKDGTLELITLQQPKDLKQLRSLRLRSLYYDVHITTPVPMNIKVSSQINTHCKGKYNMQQRPITVPLWWPTEIQPQQSP